MNSLICTCEEYPMKTNKMDRNPGTYILKNPQSSESLSVSYYYSIAHAQTINCSRSCSGSMKFRKRNVLPTRCYVVTFLNLLLLIVGFSAVEIYNKMQTIGTLYERHASRMCTRSKVAQHMQENSFKE